MALVVFRFTSKANPSAGLFNILYLVSSFFKTGLGSPVVSCLGSDADDSNEPFSQAFVKIIMQANPKKKYFFIRLKLVR